MATPSATKRCTKCREHKPLDDFKRDSSRRDGFAYRCKACLKEPQRLSSLKWAAKNKEYHRRKNKEYYDKDPEKFISRKIAQYKRDRTRLIPVLRRKLVTARVKSAEREQEFSITLDDLLEQYRTQSGRCSISGRVLEVGGQTSTTNEKPNGISLDRIDCSRGYTKDNIRLVTWAVNVAMRKWGDKVFKALCLDVVKHNGLE